MMEIHWLLEPIKMTAEEVMQVMLECIIIKLISGLNWVAISMGIAVVIILEKVFL